MKTIVVLSGAGLSAESGLPTFRDGNGLWENHKVEDVACHESWWKDKEMVLRFYNERYNSYKDVKPNAGHLALARLEEKFKVINVTQNIDNLLEQAGCKDVRHVHGSIFQKKCEWHRNIVRDDKKFKCDYEAPGGGEVHIGDLCPKCGGQLRHDVVWFGEAVHHTVDMKDWVRAVKYGGGAFICVGTSLAIGWAAMMVSFFSQVNEKYIVDVEPRAVGDYLLIEAKATNGLPFVVDKLMGKMTDEEMRGLRGGSTAR